MKAKGAATALKQALGHVSIQTQGCFNARLCLYIREFKSTVLLHFFPLSASPLSRCTVAMATIVIDPVPSNTKSFSEPKLKQSCRSSATDRGAEGMMGERGLLSLLAGVSALNSVQ